MNKRAFSTTLIVLLLLQTAQAQITVRAMAPAGTGWQTDSSVTEVTVSTPVTYVPSVDKNPQLAFDPDVLSKASSSEQAECTSWQCSNYAKTPSPAEQIQSIQSQLPSRGIPTKLSYADKLMSKARFGLAYRDSLCGVGVRTTFAKAGLFKAGSSGINSTALWDPYLRRQGFVNMGKDSPYCTVPGVIRLYNKSQIPRKEMRRRGMKVTSGDIHGHVEFVGTDGKFYAAAQSRTSRDTQLAPGRRPIIGCYVKQTEVVL